MSEDIRMQVYQELDEMFLTRVNDDEIAGVLEVVFKIDTEQANQYISDYEAVGGLYRSSFQIVILRDCETPYESKYSMEQRWPLREE